MKNAIVIFLAILISSCGNNPEEPESLRQAETAGNAGIYCYAWVSGKDSILMRLSISGQQVQGSLAYYYFEKDKSRGTIAGNMQGDTLFATYTFFSEGTQSVRDIAFLRKGNDFAAGYGEVIEKNGKMTFLNKAELDFSHSVLLRNRDCP